MNKPIAVPTDLHKISALIITFNEESNIVDAIKNVSFANEIIVVDSFSTDKTIALIQSFPNVKIMQNKFVNYAEQRNFAIRQATYPWILFLDTDERITTNLREEILQVTQQTTSIVAFQFRRVFLFKNIPLRFSGWQTDKNYRLFKKEFCCYNPDKIVHEKLIVNGKSGLLKNKLLHYSYQNYENYKQKMKLYGKMKAMEAYEKGIRPNSYHYYIRPLYQFLYQYFIRLGILDGKKGVTICYLNAYSVYVRFQTLKKLAINR